MSISRIIAIILFKLKSVKQLSLKDIWKSFSWKTQYGAKILKYTLCLKNIDNKLDWFKSARNSVVLNVITVKDLIIKLWVVHIL